MSTTRETLPEVVKNGTLISWSPGEGRLARFGYICPEQASFSKEIGVAVIPSYEWIPWSEFVQQVWKFRLYTEREIHDGSELTP